MTTENNAWQTANHIRQALFAAQGALLDSDTSGATGHVTQAQHLYAEFLRPLLSDELPDLVSQLDTDLHAAFISAQAGDSLSLAFRRGRIWTGLLRGGVVMTLRSIERGDGASARTWLLLREYRPSTSVTRPRADATQEVYALLGGRRDVDDVYSVVQAELLDTYQSQLITALAEADTSHERGFTTRFAEEIGLASGYFEILSLVYIEQRGQAAFDEMQAAFALLAEDALTGHARRFQTARQTIDDGLSGFVAAPLTDVELSRRAGQLLRFLALIPIEYASGVRGGVVIDDIEYQEALTFLESARTTFGEVVPSLESTPESTLYLETLLADLETHVRSRAEPELVQTTTFEFATTFSALLPIEWRAVSSAADIQAIRVVLNQVKAEALAGEYDEALATCVHVYAILEESLEQKLLAFAPDVALRLDSLLWQGEPGQPGLAVMLASGAPVEDIHNALLRLETALDEAELALSARTSPGAVVGNTAIVIFREGLEAILILAALLASLRHSALRRPIIAGAALACVAALVTAGLMNGVLRSYAGNGAEALVSLIALAVLLLTTNWFFHRLYWTDWIARFHDHKARLVKLSHHAGLFALGFASVYREGFETALFLQPLALNASAETMRAGGLIGLGGVVLVGAATFALNLRLPYRKMLVVTGALLGLVLVNMAGSTVYAMQLAGWLPVSPVSGLYIPAWLGHWFGIYPTWQGIAFQTGAAVFVIGSYFFARRAGRRT